jgi:hypothetical protein
MFVHRSGQRDGRNNNDRREVEKSKEVDRQMLVVVLALVVLGEMANPNLFLWIKFCGCNH